MKGLDVIIRAMEATMKGMRIIEAILRLYKGSGDSKK